MDVVETWYYGEVNGKVVVTHKFKEDHNFIVLRGVLGPILDLCGPEELSKRLQELDSTIAAAEVVRYE